MSEKLSEYELKRLKTIEENNEYLTHIGLTSKLVKSIESTKTENSQKPKSLKEKRHREGEDCVRRSNRFLGDNAQPLYTYFDIPPEEKYYDEDGSLKVLKKKVKKKRKEENVVTVPKFTFYKEYKSDIARLLDDAFTTLKTLKSDTKAIDLTDIIKEANLSEQDLLDNKLICPQNSYGYAVSKPQVHCPVCERFFTVLKTNECPKHKPCGKVNLSAYGIHVFINGSPNPEWIKCECKFCKDVTN